LAGLCLVVVGVAYFFGYIPATSRYEWRQADLALERHDLMVALRHLTPCAAAWPRDAQTHFLLAQTFRRIGDFENANQHFEKARTLGYPTEQVMFEELLGLAHGGVMQSSEATLRQYLDGGHPDRALIQEALIHGYLKQKKHDQAIDLIASWEQSSPRDWQPWYFRGLSLESLKDYGGAAKQWERALELYPEMTPIRSQLAEMLLTVGRFEESRDHFKGCLDREPRSTAAKVGLGRCHYSLGDLDEAKRLLNEALAEQPRHFSALLTRGKMELDQQNPAAALPFLESAHRIDQHKLELLVSLANAYRRLGRTESELIETRLLILRKHHAELAKVYEEFARLPDDARIQERAKQMRCEIGTLLYHVGQVDDARSWLVSILAEDPNHAPTKSMLAIMDKERESK